MEIENVFMNFFKLFGGDKMTLTTNFLGLPLKNPILVASGPWSRNASSIQKSIDAGAGAVVTETIALETGVNIRPRIFKNNGSLFNTMLYSSLALEQWENEFELIDKKDSHIICSIWGASPSEISYIATKVERMGADAIELSISAPIGAKNENFFTNPNDINKFVSAVVNSVSIPVTVKLSYNASLSSSIASSIERAGALGISAIDSLKALQGVDIESQKSLMPTYGGYTGEHIRPISLATIATLAQFTSCELSGIGGINNFKNVLEYIMLGASTIQIASAINLNGYGLISQTINQLENWLIEHSYNNINDIKGVALKSLVPYEDIPVKNLKSRVLDGCTDVDCAKCYSCCIYDAIIKEDNKPKVIKELCTGCGLCVQMCSKCFELVWE